MLDDGRLTDGQGRTVNFTTTIIIMTSNIGSQKIMDFTGDDHSALEQTVLETLRGYFRPEFLNRIDDIVIFDRIQESSMAQIVDVQLHAIASQVKMSKDIALHFDASLRESLAKDGYDPAFGARPLKRLMQKRILDPLALEIIDGNIREGQSVNVSFKGGRTLF